MTRPDIAPEHRRLAQRLYTLANRGWYVGTERTLRKYGAYSDIDSLKEPELAIRLLFTKDRMHHSVGWWRNAEYEYCWHLSISAWDKATLTPDKGPSRTSEPEDVPDLDERYWTWAIFSEDANKVWHEPGGTDPRLTPTEKMKHRHFVHQRLFLDPETFEPFVPTGEVYDITRWIPGLTPDKVDR
jgi:hypothetical protein